MFDISISLEDTPADKNDTEFGHAAVYGMH